MFEKKIIISNQAGLHARPAFLLVDLAAKYNSEAYIEKNGENFNIKSIVEVLCAGVFPGDSICLRVSGSDAEVAGSELAAFLENLPD